MVTGLVALVAVVERRADAVAYILPLFIYGLGQGSLQAPLVNFILADVPPQDAGSPQAWSPRSSSCPSHWGSQ